VTDTSTRKVAVTVMLDPDVVELLKRLAAFERISFSAAVNRDLVAAMRQREVPA
jgi:hypothetical protein